MLISDQFRFHDYVTRLSAELNRLRKMISVITGHRGNQQENDAAKYKKRQQPPITRSREINADGSRSTILSRQTSPPDERTQQKQAQAKEQKRWRHQVGQNPDVGIGKMRNAVEEQQKQKRKDAREYNGQPN